MTSKNSVSFKSESNLKGRDMNPECGRSSILKHLQDASKSKSIKDLRTSIRSLEKNLYGGKYPCRGDSLGLSDSGESVYDPYQLKSDILQILDSQTLERAKYYVRRLMRSLTKDRTNGINDINVNRWKEYGDIITDSLWIFDRRDTSGAHLGWYWGNFIPQIPHQVILRYTKKGDWILDPFAGSGTTLIECKRLGRNGIGVEINEEIVKKSSMIIDKEPNNYQTESILINGDSTTVDFVKLSKTKGFEKVQLIIMHPPYHDIIQFGKDPRDLSNADSVRKYLRMFDQVVRRTYKILENGRYMVLVVGDKYQKGEWIPLGFYIMNRVLRTGYKLTGIIVKNFEDTRAKRDQKELWRYRALVGGFYVFKHEYIFIFRKQEKKNSGADRV